MQKWTDYNGDIRKVTIDFNGAFQFTGHSWSGIGIVLQEPLDKLPDDYFDTKREAIEYFRKKKYSSIWWKDHADHEHTYRVICKNKKR